LDNEKKDCEQTALGGVVIRGTVYTIGQAMSAANISIVPAGIGTAPSAMNHVGTTGSIIRYGSIDKTEVVINYQRAYWEIGMQLLKKCNIGSLRADTMDAIITNLYIGLLKLFGMHWRPEDKQLYNVQRERILKSRFPAGKPSSDELKAFNAEYPSTKKNYTFPLYTLVLAGYVLAKGWNLAEVDGGELLEGFKRLNNYFTAISRHFEAKKVADAVQMALEQLSDYVNTTKGIVRWFMGEYYGNVPEHAKEQFKEIFEDEF
jgi:hypothetical protein